MSPLNPLLTHPSAARGAVRGLDPRTQEDLPAGECCGGSMHPILGPRIKSADSAGIGAALCPLRFDEALYPLRFDEALCPVSPLSCRAWLSLGREPAEAGGNCLAAATREPAEAALRVINGA